MILKNLWVEKVDGNVRKINEESKHLYNYEGSSQCPKIKCHIFLQYNLTFRNQIMDAQCLGVFYLEELRILLNYGDGTSMYNFTGKYSFI